MASDLIFNDVNFTTAHGVQVIRPYRSRKSGTGQGNLIKFPGTDVVRAYRTAATVNSIDFVVVFPKDNLDDIESDLTTAGAEVLTYYGDGWQAIWDGAPLEMRIVNDMAQTTIRFLI